MQYDENAEKYGYEGEMTPIECDNLTAYKGDVTIPVYGTIADAEVYIKKDVDEAIAELKARIADLEKLNHDLCERVTENDDIRLHWEEIEQTRAENERLKAKLENVQASMYADVVDANMENRRLKRALYKACANLAVCEMDYWRKCLEHYEDYFNVRTDEDLTEEKCERMIDNWRKVAHNCRAKAEEYK